MIGMTEERRSVQKKRMAVIKGKPRSFRFDEQDLARLEWLAEHWRTNGGSVIRRLLQEGAEREGMLEEKQ